MTDTPVAQLSANKSGLVLFALLRLATWNYLDRVAVGILQEPIKKEFGLTDCQLGLLGGPAFALLYVLTKFLGYGLGPLMVGGASDALSEFFRNDLLDVSGGPSPLAQVPINLPDYAESF